MNLSIIIKLIALCLVAFQAMVGDGGHAGMAAVFLILMAALDAGSHEHVQTAATSKNQAFTLILRLAALSVWPFYLVLGGLIWWGALQVPKPMQPVFTRANSVRSVAPSAPLKVQSPSSKQGGPLSTTVSTRPYGAPPQANRPAFQRLPKPGTEETSQKGQVQRPTQMANPPVATGTTQAQSLPLSSQPKAAEQSSARSK